MSRKKSPFFDKKYLTRILIYASLCIFSIGALIYIGYHMAGSSKDGIDIMYARSETIPKTVTGDAYIIRDETPLATTGGAGSFAPVAADGEKVRLGAVVSERYSNATDAALEKIHLIEDQIAFYEKCIDTHMSVGDTVNVSKDIATEVLEIRRAVYDGNLSGAVAKKSALTLDIRRLGVLSGKVTDFHGQINSLTAELNSLKAGLGTVTETVRATKAGYYFSILDGYEGMFSADSIDSVTYSEIVSTIDSAAKAEISDVDSGAGKIVGTFKWYAACRMSAAEASSFSEDVTYEVYFKNNSESVPMSVYKVLTDATDAVVLFECKVMPEGFDYTRCQEFEAVYSELVGYKIPSTALRVHDGYEGVYILDEVTVRFRRVNVLHEENGYFLCTGAPVITEDESSTESESDTGSAEESKYYYLRENDVIIKSGTGLYVGMTYNPKK